jgi:lysozyme family protein
VTLKAEGGNDDDPNDPGGRTSRGITQGGDWDVWRQTHPGLPIDVWQAPQDQIIAIYKTMYWDVVQGDSLPAGVDMMCFDIGVLTGVGEAAMLLQSVVGSDVDGEIGPDTTAAAKAMDATTVINQLSAKWLKYLQTRANAATYIHGWTNRVNTTTAAALGMVGTAAAPVVAPTPWSTATEAPTPTTPTGDPPWIILGRTFVENTPWSGGPMPAKMQAWMTDIGTRFPEMAPYCQALMATGSHSWFAWCGFFVQAMLAPSGIRGPISAAGLQGETTEGDWAYVDAWRSWSTKVWDAADDGDINDAQPQSGDVLIWKTSRIHHVSFYDHPEPTTDTFASLGGDQGSPLRVCLEDLPMSWCVGIRRPPT